MATLAELAHAEAILEECVAKAERDPAKDHNKYTSEIDGLKWQVTQIRRSLQADGLLERSPKEALHHALDTAFPRARSREVFSYDGRQYRKEAFAAHSSRSRKTVYAWDHRWVDVAEEAKLEAERRARSASRPPIFTFRTK
ncbi:hypothetical protein PVT71_00225 [Salipiger sp. H15]|uniref:Uncharacterized protein n=1 Tax=Alloyangia sp. H15 TaxID=3029062 RepID=A0AAU8AGM3_9RHOB